MDPYSGQVYGSLDAALDAGVKNPVEIIGRPEDVQRVSDAVKSKWQAEKRKKAKAAKLARRKNR